MTMTVNIRPTSDKGRSGATRLHLRTSVRNVVVHIANYKSIIPAYWDIVSVTNEYHSSARVQSRALGELDDTMPMKMFDILSRMPHTQFTVFGITAAVEIQLRERLDYSSSFFDRCSFVGSQKEQCCCCGMA